MTSLFSPDSGRLRPQFTAAQMEELHLQALVYKHMLMGVPVPSDLLLAVRRSFDAMAAARLYHHHHFLRMGYSSYLGKKLDPEPGRCRRTDGKKWRCAKEAYPDSKYCERHMRRGKNRSRKPVETPPHLQSQQSTVAPPAAEASLALSGGSDTLCLQNLNTQFKANGQLAVANGICSSQLQLHTRPYERNDKDFRYPYGTKAMVGEHIPYLESPKIGTGLDLCSTQNNPRGLTHSPLTSFSASGFPIGFALESNQYQHSAANELDGASINIMQKCGQPQTSLFGHDFGSLEPVKQNQSLRPFFDEWPNTRSSWSDQEESKSVNASFSST